MQHVLRICLNNISGMTQCHWSTWICQKRVAKTVKTKYRESLCNRSQLADPLATRLWNRCTTLERWKASPPHPLGKGMVHCWQWCTQPPTLTLYMVVLPDGLLSFCSDCILHWLRANLWGNTCCRRRRVLVAKTWRWSLWSRQPESTIICLSYESVL